MCLGHTHSLMGLTVGVATAPSAPVHTPVGQIGWIAVCGGTALLPDIDQSQSSIGQLWGVFTSGPARLIEWAARGHRWGTHDAVLSPLAFGTLATAAAAWAPTRIVLVALAVGLALRACHFVIPGRTEFNQLWNAVWSFAAAWWIVGYGGPHIVDWLPVSVMVGIWAHLLGDAFTIQGLPIPIYWIEVKTRGKKAPAKGKGRGKAKKRWYDDGRMELPSWKGRIWLPSVHRPRGKWLPRVRWWRTIRAGAFATGHGFERYVVFPVTAVLLVVGIVVNTRVGDMLAAAQSVAEQGIVQPSPAPSLPRRPAAKPHPATKPHRAP